MQYEKLLADHYPKAKDTTWSAWKDSDLRQHLIDNNCELASSSFFFSLSHALSFSFDPKDIKSDAQHKRDELIAIASSKIPSVSAPSYLTWPDARLRAYLRDNKVDDTKYTDRPSLLQEVRIRYIQSQNRVEGRESSASRLFPILLELTSSFRCTL